MTAKHHWYDWLKPGILPEERGELHHVEPERSTGDVIHIRPLWPVPDDEDEES